MILIDDCSTDHSTKVVEKWMGRLLARFNNFVYIPRQENMGVIYNCNHGLSLAEGKYICLFASDDAMLAKNIEEKVKFLESDLDFGMVYSDGYFIKESDHLINHIGGGSFKRFQIVRNYIKIRSLFNLLKREISSKLHQSWLEKKNFLNLEVIVKNICLKTIICGFKLLKNIKLDVLWNH